jgi:hypothetical protein
MFVLSPMTSFPFRTVSTPVGCVSTAMLAAIVADQPIAVMGFQPVQTLAIGRHAISFTTIGF